MGNEFAAISRRDFLKLTAKSAVFSSAFLTGCATMVTGGSNKTARAIDIHHHYFPAQLINEIKQHGKSLGIEYLPSKGEAHSLSFGKGNRTGVDPEIMDVDKRLEVMRDGRVAIATVESQPSAQVIRSTENKAKLGRGSITKAFTTWSSAIRSALSGWQQCRCKIPCVPQVSWNTRFASSNFPA
jgi:hypothetical protein